METLRQDLRYGLRALAKTRSFTAAAVLTLGLGIGLTTTIFSVASAMLLTPFPFRAPERLVDIRESRGDRTGVVSYPHLAGLRKQARSLERIAAFATSGFVMTGGESPALILGGRVSPEFFEVLGVGAVRGRTFLPGESAPGADRVVILSQALWRSQFDSDPEILGKTVRLSAEPYTVIGVMPADFFIHGNHQFWVPGYADSVLLDPANRGATVPVVARLKGDISPIQAQAEVEAIARGFEELDPEINRGLAFRIRPIRVAWTSYGPEGVLYLLSAVGFLLLIACANVANLTLSRAEARRQEIAVRAALGAGRLRLVKQLLTESALVSVFGCLLGLVLAWWTLPLVVSFIPENLARYGFPGGLQSIRLDHRVLLFAVALTFATAAIFGLAPALAVSRPDLTTALRSGGRVGTTDSFGAGKRFSLTLSTQELFVVAEVSLSLVLVFGASLMIRTLVGLERADRGVELDKVLRTGIPLLPQKYPDAQRRAVFVRELLGRVETVPGVESAAISSFSLSRRFVPDAAPSAAAGEEVHGDDWVVSIRYFRTLGIPLLEGREFDQGDGPAATQVAIINQTMARRYWPGMSPLGKRIRLDLVSRPGGERSPWLIIVGVVGDVRWMRNPTRPFDLEPQPSIYRSQLQNPDAIGFLSVRARIAPGAIVDAVRREIRAVDPDLPLAFTTPENALDAELARPRFNRTLAGIFAAAALLLSAVGSYGVMSYAVSRRTREIGLRIALGARAADVLKLVAWSGLRLALIGVTTGVAGAMALARFAESQLYGVSARDPESLIAAAFCMILVALLASLIPARRAAKADPMVALRNG